MCHVDPLPPLTSGSYRAVEIRGWKRWKALQIVQGETISAEMRDLLVSPEPYSSSCPGWRLRTNFSSSLAVPTPHTSTPLHQNRPSQRARESCLPAIPTAPAQVFRMAI